MKKTKRYVTLLLSLTLILSIIPVISVSATNENNSNNAIVDVSAATGAMNLTEAGTLDWIHVTGTEINRKMQEPGTNSQTIGALNAANTDGCTFGQSGDQVERWQSFVPTVSGPLTTAQVAVIKKGNPGDLVAKLYEFESDYNTTKTLLATVTIAANQVADNTPISLNFVDANGNKIALTANTTYAVALTSKSLGSGDANIYWWCKSGNTWPAGKINENGTWIEEGSLYSLYCSLQVVIGEAAQASNLLQFSYIGDVVKNNVTDSPVAYSWTDGTPTSSAQNTITAGYIGYKEDTKGEVTEDAGWKIDVPSASYIQTLTFVSGIWEASAQIQVVDGDGNSIYTNDNFTATSPVKVAKHTITIAPNTAITVSGKLTNKTHGWGNISMGGITLAKTEMDSDIDYAARLKNAVETANVWKNEAADTNLLTQLTNSITAAQTALDKDTDLTQDEAFEAYTLLNAAITAVQNNVNSGSYANTYANGMTSSFGWEGDKDAPIAWIDGTYWLRDRNITINFGVTDLPAKSISWYNAEGYLPCFVSEYEKDGISYKIENFADLVVVDNKNFEVAYSRITAKNNNDIAKVLRPVSAELIPLNDTAKNSTGAIAAGETIVRDYCIGADRFSGTYDYPSNATLAEQGSWDAHYAHMKAYWNDRLDGIIQISDIPDEKLINAYKAGYIYTLIIRDDIIRADGSVAKELHVGENGYDELFDHDTIGIVSTLLISGDFTYAKDYLATLPAELQYQDAKWKYSWPYALYYMKTGDLNFIQEKFDVIKGNTHNIETDRINNGTGIIKKTYAIDSNGYWLIDNWAALTGLTTYQYLCEALYAKTGTDEYQTEAQWAAGQYTSLLKATDKIQKDLTWTDGTEYPYLSISMEVPTEQSARGDVRDANWASMFHFGRWAWDGYLFGAEQEDTYMLSKIDDTYTHGFERRKGISDTIYNFGGYPHGYYSSCYNAGYAGAALRGEQYRDAGIKAYQFMIEHSMSGPFGWWEGIDFPSESSGQYLDHTTYPYGGGSCQHMWGQSVNTKVLIDSLISEKADGTIIIGRGIPTEWNADGETIEISNFACNAGKRVGYKLETADNKLTVTLTGDTLTNPVSVELLALKDNIAMVSNGCEFDAENGIVTIPAGTKQVAITMGQKVDVTGVSLNQSTMQLKVGESNTLTATIEPSNATDQTVTWISSNETAATVDQFGKVTAVAVGTATITATTADGNKTATCAVTVTKAADPTTPIKPSNPSQPSKPVEPTTPATPSVFHDVSRSDWFYSSVQWAVDEGLMNGVGNNRFDPNGNTSRAMVLTMLYRQAGSPNATGKGTWYADAQKWAMETGISDGSNMTDNITREQLATMLWRQAGSPKADTSLLNHFADGAKVSDYAKQAVAWAIEQGILSGKGQNNLDPQGFATRAETAAMFMRLFEK